MHYLDIISETNFFFHLLQGTLVNKFGLMGINPKEEKKTKALELSQMTS